MSQEQRGEESPLKQAARRLKAGGLVAMPTETVYGLAAAIHSEAALKAVFHLKERPFFDPLIVHIAELEQAPLVAREWPPLADALAKALWPGPLTLVLPKRAEISSLITSGLDTVGIRLPRHPVARDLIRLTQSPLAAPSANKFGRTSPTRAEHVRDAFPGDDVFILDGGPCEVGVESTVVALAGNEIQILRPGTITETQLREAAKSAGISASVCRAISNASPGHTEHHYMPDIPLVLVRTASTTLPPELNRSIAQDLGLSKRLLGVELRLSPQPALAARELYARMRECAASGASFIYALQSPAASGESWEAVWDRLSRAASRIYTS